MATQLLRIGTRGSALALAQATEVKGALERAHPGVVCELTVIKTSGDDPSTSSGQVLRPPEVPDSGQALGTVPRKGLFVKEIEEALFKGEIAMAVHSVKDLETTLPAGLRLGGVLARQDPRDALVTRNGETLERLPAGTKVGISSLRRGAQLKRLRRDLEIVPIQGNVDTRLKKLETGGYGALILAACGLMRLERADRIAQFLDPAQMVPAAGQGALGIEIRADDREVASLIQSISDPDSFTEVQAERALLSALGVGCQVPVGALARVNGENLTLTGMVLSPDGLKAVRKEVSGPRSAAEKLGKELASHLRAAGADRLLYGQWEGKGQRTEVR